MLIVGAVFRLWVKMMKVKVVIGVRREEQISSKSALSLRLGVLLKGGRVCLAS